MLKAIGFTDDDLAKPLVGVATTWIETMPCNYNQRRLAEFVKEGIRAAGGTPMEFNTIAVSDGVSMGTEGMKASLISREVIADSIELVVRGHLLDGVVCLVGCDKTIPAAAMALGRLDVPGLVLYNGTIYPGTYQGVRNATVVTVYEAIGAYRAGKITARRAVRDRERLMSRSRRVRRPVHRQHDEHRDGVHRPVAGRAERDPCRGPRQGRGGSPVGRTGDGPGRRDARPSSFVTRQALENGIASVAATGGSTNGVLHLLAIAHEFGSSSTSTTSRRSPSARRSWPTCARAAATPRRTCTTRVAIGLVMRRAAQARWTAPRRDHGRRPDDRQDRRRHVGDRGPAGRPLDRDPLKPTGGLAILRGTLAPDGCVVKLAGHERRLHRGRPACSIRRRPASRP